MDTPTSERSSLRGIPPTEGLLEGEGEDVNVIVSAVGEITTPIRKQIHFCGGSGYAGTFPTSENIALWPGPRGGAFIWSGSSSEGFGGNQGHHEDHDSRIFLHRLELKIPSENGNENISGESVKALYSCREVQMQKLNPAMGFLKRLFTAPKKTLIHPYQSRGMIQGIPHNYCVLPDYPFGSLGGRDPRPVIWNGKTGQVVEFDPKSLKCRENQKIMRESGVVGISDVPVFDHSIGRYVVLVRVSDHMKFSKYQVVALHPGMPIIATCMGPKAMSLNLLVMEKTWIICSPVHPDRRLFYLLDRQRGRLMAVYQSNHSHIKKFISVSASEDKILLMALMRDGSIRRYSFENVKTEVAKFDGAAGLMGTFPVADFETVSDGPFEQVEPIVDNLSGGFVARQESSITKLSAKWEVEVVKSVSPAILSDFSMFPMWNRGSGKDGDKDAMLVVMCTDPYKGKSTMLMYDVGDMAQVSKIAVDHEMSGYITPPIYIPTRSAN